MVWPFSKKKEQELDSVVETPREPRLTNYSSGQKFLLEDTKPRFTNESQNKQQRLQEQAQIRDAWNTLSWQDFSLAKLTSIPCFRDAGMSGFTSMFVVGTVIFLYHKNPARAANWSIGGYMLGSIVGWEQCRMKRKRGFQVAEMAKQTVATKERPMVKQHLNDDRVKKEWEGHTTESINAMQKRPWYKFW